MNTPQATSSHSHSGGSLQPRRVMVVDDDGSVRHSIANILQESGYETLEAGDGPSAVEQFASHRPDVVLLDINLPGRNGWQVLDTVSQMDPLVPIIVITARPNQQGVASGRGVDALMEKPLDIDLLLKAIQRFADQPMRDRCRRLTDPSFKTEFLGVH